MEFEGKTLLDKIMIFLRGIGLIFLYIVLSSLLSSIIISPFKDSNVWLNIGGILANLIIVGMLIILFHKRLKRDFKDFKKNYKKYIKQVIPYWVVGFIIMIVSNLIINLLINSGNLAANEEANREILTKVPIYSLLDICLFAPLSEELLFRASFKNAFKNIFAFAIVTGLIFAGMHVATGFDSLSISAILKNWKELLYFIPYGALGIAFGLAYFKTNNIFSSMFLHSMHNTLSVFFIILASIGV